MKKITLLVALVFLTMQSFGVALKVVEPSKITFHNFSASTYDVSSHIITVGSTQYSTNSLMVVSGVLNTTAGSMVTFQLPTNAPVNQGSIALWAPGTQFPNPIAALMIDFVQWGATGQAFEAEAISVGKWSANAYVNATLPITRDNDYNSWGVGNWASSMHVDESLLNSMVEIGPVPFTDEVTVTFEQGHNVNEVLLYNMLGELIYHKQIMQSSLITTIVTSELQNGVYLMELRRTGKQSIVKRLVKR
jgi:hypothetical protein